MELTENYFPQTSIKRLSLMSNNQIKKPIRSYPYNIIKKNRINNVSDIGLKKETISKTSKNFYKKNDSITSNYINSKKSSLLNIKKLNNLDKTSEMVLDKSPSNLVKKLKKPFNFTNYNQVYMCNSKNSLNNNSSKNLIQTKNSSNDKQDDVTSIMNRKTSIKNIKETDGILKLKKYTSDDLKIPNKIAMNPKKLEMKNLKENKDEIINNQKYGNLEITNVLKTKEKTNKIDNKFSRILQTINQSYNVLQGLGEGNFANIFLAEEIFSKKLVAIKISKSRKFSLKKEFEILSLVKNNHVICPIEYFEERDNTPSMLVLEYAGARTLKDFQASFPKNCFNENLTVFFIGQIIKAIKELHLKNIAHSDIKLENVVLEDNNNFNCKLIDFGFADFHSEKIKDFYCGALGYMSPQILAKSPFCPFKADVWAIGVLIYKMLFNIFPFKGRDEMDILRRIKTGDLFFPSTIPCSPNIKKFVKAILVYKENLRPDIFTTSDIFDKIFV